ncbi:hypothetical protein UlMin_002207 [Ulmus minor]
MDGKLRVVLEATRRLEGLLNKQGSPSNLGSGHHQEDKGLDGGVGGNRDLSDHRRKLELPLFEGENPHGWIFWAERYFAYRGVEETEKITVATICLEGRALSWYLWANAKTPFQSWPGFRAALLARFSHLGDEDPIEQLLALQQEGSVADFRNQFEMLAVALPQLPESVFKSAFMNGLREEICVELRLLRLGDLEASMVMAQQIEERNPTLEKLKKGRGILLVLEDDPKEEENSPTYELSTIPSSTDLSFNSLMGFTSAQTLKLQGMLNGKSVVVLIDSGASHSFISSRLVTELSIPFVSTEGYGVQVGDGTRFKLNGICKRVKLWIQGTWIEEDFLPFELGCIDVVLGVTWLQKLGEVKENWKVFTMEFQLGNTLVHWQGDLTLYCTPVSLKSLI